MFVFERRLFIICKVFEEPEVTKPTAKSIVYTSPPPPPTTPTSWSFQFETLHVKSVYRLIIAFALWGEGWNSWNDLLLLIGFILSPFPSRKFLNNTTQKYLWKSTMPQWTMKQKRFKFKKIIYIIELKLCSPRMCHSI